MLEPRTTPTAPDVPEGELKVQDVIEWYEAWVSKLEQAHLQSEADKAAIRGWIKDKDE
ncbi:MAG: hypothetical protein ACLFMQ_01730 [Desulfohalobiaceae bacterium]